MIIVDPEGLKRALDEAEDDPSVAEKEMPYYQQCIQNDPVELLEAMWASGHWRWRIKDGKTTLYYPFEQQIQPHSPWRYFGTNADCFLYSDVLFETVSKKIPKGFVPEYCHNCYKVVVAPRTVKELFALEQLMTKCGANGIPCKCGIEIRTYVTRLYGGYFYTRSKNEGRERWALVRGLVDQHPGLGPDIPVILKRACTEMERKHGPSNEWLPPTKAQQKLEAMILEIVEFEPYIVEQTQPFVNHLHRKWLEWAFQNGDETYLEYTGGNPIKGGPVTYHSRPEMKKEDANG
jgi:hypothetical protein